MVNSQDLRLVYNNALITAKTAGLNVRQEYMSQAYLRFEVPITATGTDFEFAILNNQSVQGSTNGSYVTEQRLKLQDSFFVSHVGFFLLNVSSLLPGPVTNVSQRYLLTTFPSSYWLGLGANVPYLMGGIYEGSLQLTVNNRIVCTQWDLFKHLVRPQTQYPAYVGAVPNEFYENYDQINGAEDGFYPCEPNWVLIGSKDNVLKLQLPVALGTEAIPADCNVRAVVIVRGILAQNSTSVN